MNTFFCLLARVYICFFAFLQKITEDWFLGLFLRCVFAQVLLFYFIDSAMTKLGRGFPGIFIPQPSAYVEILPTLMESIQYDPNRLAWPWHLVVYLGTYGEIVLPILIIAGLLTRLASLAMIVFICILSYVDIFGHHLESSTIGTFLDSDPSALIADQRLLWISILVVLVIRGGGVVSLDWFLSKGGCSRTRNSSKGG